MNIVEAVATIQKYLQKYEKDKTEDGPYIQVGVDYVEVVYCNGTTEGRGQAIEEILSCIDQLNNA